MSEQARTPISGADMSAIDVFRLDDEGQSFEDFGKENGFHHWYASDLGAFLGYENYDSFRKVVVNRAMVACATLNIPAEENFVVVRRLVGGTEISDVKLSRFACYLSAMNADPKKPKVARAQSYFAVMAEGFRQYLENSENIERLAVRDDVTKGEKSLSAVATQAGVQNYAFFQNAGYRGLYNMNLRELKIRKGLPNGKILLDFMGKEELAANLFRITQTEAKIKNESVTGQPSLERTAEHVGRTVRNTMRQISGTVPENLPLVGDIADTRKKIKATHKEFKKLDKPKRK